MASTPHQCLVVAGKVCNHFILAKDNDSHTLCTNCHGKCFTSDDCCADCHNWTDKNWEKVSVHHEKLAIQREKKKELKAKSSSCFLGLTLPFIMPVPLSKMQAISYDASVSMTNASSDMCTTTFVITFLVVSVKPYVPPKPISNSGEPNGKRKGELSGCLLGLCHDEVWVEFQQFAAYWWCWALHHTIPNRRRVIASAFQLIAPD